LQALILNSGLGKRMGSLTAEVPKCLVELKDKQTILSRQLDQLIKSGINEVIITTGPFEEKIKEYVKEYFEKQLKISYVHNSHYDTTNYIYSIILAAGEINRDLVLMHGDMVFAGSVLDKLLHSDYPDAVVVDPHAPLPEKDFKGKIEEGKVKKISVDLQGGGVKFLLPMYCLTKNTFDYWVKQMRALEQEGKLKAYAEEGLNRILDELNLYPVYINQEVCMEIDDPEDLEKARKLLQ